eukprot:1156533-Pelagomonas_calceolata.AAC.7
MVVEDKTTVLPQAPGLALTEELRKSSKTAHGISDALVNARILVVFTDRELFGKAIRQRSSSLGLYKAGKVSTRHFYPFASSARRHATMFAKPKKQAFPPKEKSCYPFPPRLAELAPFKDVLCESALFRAEAYKQDVQFYLG